MNNGQLPIRVGEVIGGKYRVDRVVGSGGMSIVVLAWHLELEQKVALKILHGAGIDFGDASERFRREARAAARIRSEHVARVLDVGTLANGSAYMVLEYLEGNDLAEELAKRGPLPIEESVRYVLEALEALAEAHAAGIVHRDLKPENLFLATRPDGTRLVKVLDFGISKSLLTASITDLALTKTASFVGSPLYMSPEQMRSSRSVDHRADIWSLGAILYEAVTGRVPYFADSIGELCALLLQEVPPPITQLRAGVPPEFEAVVLKCLEKERDRRYASVADLATALLPFAPGSGLHAERARRVLTLAGASQSPVKPSDELPNVRPIHSRSLAQSHPLANRFTPVTPEPTLASFSKTDTSGLRTKKVPYLAAALMASFIAIGWVLGSSFGASDRSQMSRASAPEGLSTRVAAARSEPNHAPIADPVITPLPDAATSAQQSSAATSASTIPAKPGPNPASARVSANRLAANRSVRPSIAEAGTSSEVPRSLETSRAATSAASAASASTEAKQTPRVDAWDPSTFGGRH